MKDYYYILGIDKNASLKEIEEAYTTLWSKFHPDKNDHDPYFENLHKDIKEAFHYLSNSSLRKAYDEKHTSFFGKDAQNTIKEDHNHTSDPVIIDFKSDKDSVYEGDTIKITWQTKYADMVTISCFRGEQESTGNKMLKVTGIRDREVIPLTIKAANSETNKSVVKKITVHSQVHIDIKKKFAGITPSHKEEREDAVIKEEVKTDSTPKKEEKTEVRESRSEDNKENTATHDKNSKAYSDANPTTSIKSNKVKKIGPIFLFITTFAVLIIIVGGIISRNHETTILTENKKANTEEVYKKTEKEELPNIATTPKEAIKLFFTYINQGNFRSAYWLSDNEAWKPFKKFSEEAWNNYKSIKPVSFLEKLYDSKYNADKIIEATFTTFDPTKAKTLKLTYDFHLKMNHEKKTWQIVRMVYPKKIDTWYYDDPLYEYKSNEKLLNHNKPYALLQRYYDNFGSKELVENNAEYYNDVLVIHYKDELITKSRALTKDYEDFINNDIKSYQILVDVVNLKVDQYEKFDIVSTPVNYYVTKLNGDKSNFTIDNITVALSKDNSSIYGIGRDFSVDDFLDALTEYSN